VRANGPHFVLYRTGPDPSVAKQIRRSIITLPHGSKLQLSLRAEDHCR